MDQRGGPWSFAALEPTLGEGAEMISKRWMIGLIALALPLRADALGIPDVRIVLDDGSGNLQDALPTGRTRDGKVFEYSGALGDPNGLSVRFTVSADPDPFFAVNYAIENKSAVDKSFSLAFSLPIAPAIPGPTMFGYSVARTLTDADFSGTGFDGPTSIFFMHDGVTTVFDPFAGSALIAFPGESVSVPSLNVGLPGPTIAGPPVLQELSGGFHTTLSAGDIATYSLFYVAMPVPEPSAAILVAVGVMALGLVRRRG